MTAGAEQRDAPCLQRRRARLPEGSARLDHGQHAAGSGGGEPPQPHQPRLQGAAAAVAEEARGQRLALPELAEGVWRDGLELDAEIHLRDGDGARQFALSLVVQHQDGGARPDEVRQRRAEEALPAQDRRGRGAVVPGLFRAGLGLRPREPAHQGGTAGRPLPRQRPEDLDDQRALGRLDLLPGAHLERGQAPGGHLLPADRHEVARHQASIRSIWSTARARRCGTRSTRSSSPT